jgi:uncharacterized membrane protein (DUF373 family)
MDGDDAGDRPGPRRHPLGRAGRPPRPGLRGVERSIFVLEHAQDVVTVVVGIVLLLLAATLLVSGIADFVHSVSAAKVLSATSVTNAAAALVEEVLLVLILIEIVHTVVLSLRSHQLLAQPFLIIGLVAVIRDVLFVLTGEKELSTSVLALLIAMVAVFVLGLIAVNRFDRPGERDPADT